MITTQKTQSLSFHQDIEELLCEIDVKLSSIAKDKYDSDRFGTKCKTNKDQFFILSNYRRILEQRASGNSCLREYNLDDITNNIKQYLSSGKILKLKESQELDKQGISNPALEYQDIVNVKVINNSYGNITTFNTTVNSYTTDTSDLIQSDW